MTTELSLKCTSRTETGTAFSRRLRHDLRIPAIIYGGKSAPQSLSLNQFDWANVVNNDNLYTSVFNLDIDGKATPVILKAVQRHPTSGVPSHIDFFRADSSNPVARKLPIKVLNEEACYGVRREGGVIVRQVNEIIVKGRLNKLPTFIEIDVEHLNVSESIRLSDLNLDKDVSIPALNRGNDQILLSVSSKRGAKVDLDDEDGEGSTETEGEES